MAPESALLMHSILSERASKLDSESIQQLISYSDLLFLRQKNRRADVSRVFPRDVLYRIGQYLTPFELKAFRGTCRSVEAATSRCWYDIGERLFEGLVVSGETFSEAVGRRPFNNSILSVFNKFEKSWRFMDHAGCEYPRPETVHVAIRRGQLSFTLPVGFGVTWSVDSLFIDIAAEVHFGPDLIRSVVGVVDSLKNLECDRALSRDSWGIGFGPLSGILSSGGFFFDRFETYHTGPFIRDYLASAMVDTVGLRIGIFFSRGKIAFYRLSEESADWECTGFVYQAPSMTTLYPSVMFSRVGESEEVTFQLRGMYNKPPYFPHDNLIAQDTQNWQPFEDEAFEIMQNPQIPNPQLPDMPIGRRVREEPASPTHIVHLRE